MGTGSNGRHGVPDGVNMNFIRNDTQYTSNNI